MQNFITIRLWDFAPYICEVAYQMFTRLVFWVLPTRYRLQAAAPILTINTSKDVVSRKDVPFGGPKNKFSHFDLIFANNANNWSIFDGLRNFRLKTRFSMGDFISKHPENDELRLLKLDVE